MNALLTCLCVAQEWGRLDSFERKSLRVSHPKGTQRSHYFLSLPYRFSVPLITSATLLHFFISQSIFPIRTAYLTLEGKREPSGDGTVIGYSILGIILSLVSGVLVLTVILIVGCFPRYRSIIPMASTSSIAIAAACHRPDEDIDAHLLPLRWSVVEWEGDLGHCAFSTEADDMRPGDQGRPLLNQEYA